MHEVERELRRLVRAGLPGAFVFIEDRGGSSQFLTAGWADLKKETRMTPESHYRVGSTTKTFTAVIALQLVSTAPHSKQMLDLATFFRALLVESRLLNAEMLGRMVTVLPDDPPAAEAYGLGLIADPLSCGVMWGHGGGGFGYQNLPYMRLETGRFAVFMLNGSYGYRASAMTPPGGRPRFSPRFRASVYCEREY